MNYASLVKEAEATKRLILQQHEQRLREIRQQHQAQLEQINLPRLEEEVRMLERQVEQAKSSIQQQQVSDRELMKLLQQLGINLPQSK